MRRSSRTTAALRSWSRARLHAIERPLAAPDLPIDVAGTAFQEAVWRELRKIPPGETRSYAEIAAAIGQPKAVRAVGTANGDNHVAVLIPCHRVIRSDGSLGGYAGGLERKRKLLAAEGHKDRFAGAAARRIGACRRAPVRLNTRPAGEVRMERRCDTVGLGTAAVAEDRRLSARHDAHRRRSVLSSTIMSRRAARHVAPADRRLQLGHEVRRCVAIAAPDPASTSWSFAAWASIRATICRRRHALGDLGDRTRCRLPVFSRLSSASPRCSASTGSPAKATRAASWRRLSHRRSSRRFRGDVVPRNPVPLDRGVRRKLGRRWSSRRRCSARAHLFNPNATWFSSLSSSPSKPACCSAAPTC